MSIERFPVGMELDVSYPNFRVSLTIHSTNRLRFEIKEEPFARTETVDIEVAPLGNSTYAVSWRRKAAAHSSTSRTTTAA